MSQFCRILMNKIDPTISENFRNFVVQIEYDVWVTSGDPERNNILRLEDGVQAVSDDSRA